jgi:hypothetical protein
MNLSGGVTFKSWVNGIIGALKNVVVPVILALAFCVLVWGIANYFIIHGNDEARREEGRQFILWGFLGMLVLFSVWGLVNLLLSTLGIAPTS